MTFFKVQDIYNKKEKQMENYYNSQERIDAALMSSLSASTGLWKSMETMPLKTRHDFSGITSSGKKCIIEVKQRIVSSETFKEVFVEPLKLDDFGKALANDFLPLYINFFADDTALVWDMSQAMDCKYQPITIYDKGDETYKVVNRIALPTKNAIKFKKENEKWIRTK